MKFSTFAFHAACGIVTIVVNNHQAAATTLRPSAPPCTEGPCPSDSTSKVNLIILSESGCPPCQSQITGPLNDMINSPGFADILNVRQFR